MGVGTMFKQHGRVLHVWVLLLVALVTLAGCGPRATSGELAASADDAALVIDMPALVVDIGSNGQISLGGQQLADLGARMGQDLSTFTMTPDQVAGVTAAGIQHIQVDNTPNGLLILINGVAVPSIAWDGEKLVATAQLIQSMGPGVALLDKLLPLIANFGIGAIVRFPMAEGAEAIPMVVADSAAAAAALAAQQQFLATVGRPPVFQLTVNYAADGTWTVADMAQSQWAQLAPQFGQFLNLDPAMIQSASAQGIDEVTISSNTEGIFIAINGQSLPYITWAEGRVSNAIALIRQSGMLGNDANLLEGLNVAESLLPAVTATNVELTVRFP
jgi:hypothetical protein